MKKTAITLLMLMALLPVLAVNTQKTYAQSPGTELLILPEKNIFTANTTAPGTKFLINVTIYNVTDLFSWQIGVRWNSSLLNFSSVVKPSDMVYAGKTYVEAIDTGTPGYLVYGQALLTPPGVNVTKGTLCQIELQIMPSASAPATSEINFANIGVDTFLLNSQGLDIPGGFTPKGAYFVYTILQTQTATVDSQNFDVSIISNGEIVPNSLVAIKEETAIAFNITGTSGQLGLVNVTVPKSLLKATDPSAWTVYVNGESTTAQIVANETHTFVYVEFTFGSPVTVKIKGTWIVPEFATVLPLIIFSMGATGVTLATHAIKLKKRKK
jgi:hypothetical protein